MNRPNMPWWSNMRLRRKEPAPETDYADMGTAFGLDAVTCVPDRDAAPPAQGDAGPATDRLNRRSIL